MMMGYKLQTHINVSVVKFYTILPMTRPHQSLRIRRISLRGVNCANWWMLAIFTIWGLPIAVTEELSSRNDKNHPCYAYGHFGYQVSRRILPLEHATCPFIGSGRPFSTENRWDESDLAISFTAIGLESLGYTIRYGVVCFIRKFGLQKRRSLPFSYSKIFLSFFPFYSYSLISTPSRPPILVVPTPVFPL